jgi:hypothetical protein
MDDREDDPAALPLGYRKAVAFETAGAPFQNGRNRILAMSLAHEEPYRSRDFARAGIEVPASADGLVETSTAKGTSIRALFPGNQGE